MLKLKTHLLIFQQMGSASRCSFRLASPRNKVLAHKANCSSPGASVSARPSDSSRQRMSSSASSRLGGLAKGGARGRCGVAAPGAAEAAAGGYGPGGELRCCCAGDKAEGGALAATSSSNLPKGGMRCFRVTTTHNQHNGLITPPITPTPLRPPSD